MKDSIFEIACPCCGAKLEIDGELETVLAHEAPKARNIPADLRQAVRDLESEAANRDRKFEEQFEAERRHTDELSKKFEGLLKRQQGKKITRPALRDIDLD